MKKEWNIMVVEDDENLAYLLGEHLASNDFNPIICHQGKKALSKISTDQIHLCILDIVLPDLDGISLAKEIRQVNEHVPIVFLTSRNLKSDQLIAYNMGADDYLTKPFDPDVLVLKVNAILSRCYREEEEKPDRLDRGKSSLILSRRKLRTGDREVSLSKTECGILELLFSTEDRPVSRESMMKNVWGKSDFFISKSLDVYITRIRKILREYTDLELETIRSVGYILNTSTRVSELG